MQQRAECEPLPVDDRQALEELLYELEQAEWAAVCAALSRLRRDQEALATDLGQLQAQNAVVAAQADRYVDLLARAKTQMAGLTSEREALRTTMQ